MTNQENRLLYTYTSGFIKKGAFECKISPCFNQFSGKSFTRGPVQRSVLGLSLELSCPRQIYYKIGSVCQFDRCCHVRVSVP